MVQLAFSQCQFAVPRKHWIHSAWKNIIIITHFVEEVRKETASRDKGINTPLTFSIQVPFEVSQFVAVVMVRVWPSFQDAFVSVPTTNSNKHVITRAPNW